MEKKNFLETGFIGAKVKSVMVQRGMTITELANKIYRSRTICYDLFLRRSIDSSLLMDLSLALNYNFFNDLANEIDEQIANIH